MHSHADALAVSRSYILHTCTHRVANTTSAYASGAMDEVSPNFCSFRHIVLAICFHVVVTVAVPIEWACTVMRCAFFRVIVLTTLTMAIVT